MQDVMVDPVRLDRLTRLVAPERAARLADAVVRARTALGTRTVWNINATARGGGVAEMLQSLLGYPLGAGFDVRWAALDGDPQFFAITKRIHNLLHGSPGDGGPLSQPEHEHYQAVLAENGRWLHDRVRPGDVVILHDPQTAGLATGLRAAGATVVWRSHVGRDTPNEHTETAWAFLRRYVEGCDAHVFTRAAYAPSWLPAGRVSVIAPSLDPFSPKNAEMSAGAVRAVLERACLLAGDPGAAGPDPHETAFTRVDGSSGQVRRHPGVLLDDSAIPAHARLVVQVSRWDRLKDMDGVLRSFADAIDMLPDDAHLLLAGPDVTAVSDDPEGAEVLARCRRVRTALPAATAARVHLAALPMDDPDENAHLVNALQRHAAVVVQKSLVEGFGLTVTEPMWKARPVVASGVGGISDQIVDGRSGLLLPDPTDLTQLAVLVHKVLVDDSLADRLGAAARARVRDHFLGDRHLLQYVDLLTSLS